MLRSTIAVILSVSCLTAGAAEDRNLIERARHALQAGNAAQAAQLFERATSQGDSLEADLGYISASLEAGRFRNALSYSNLVAGEHVEAAALALQAYLLDRTGQTERALAALIEAAQSRDDDALVAAQADILIDRLAPSKAAKLIDDWFTGHVKSNALAEIRRRADIAEGRVAQGSDFAGAIDGYPWRPSAFEKFSIAQRAVKRAGNGVVFDKGERVLTQATLVAGAESIELRNSLGHLRTGRVEKIESGLAVIRLTHAYSPMESLSAQDFAANSDAHFCFVLSYPAANALDPAYPALSPGVVIRRKIGASNLTQITSVLGRDQGSPVFDSTGKLIGIALRDLPDLTAFGTGNFAASLDGVRALVGEGASATPGASRAPSVEELYERLAPAVVQIIVKE